MNISIFYFLHSFAFQYQWLDGIIWFFAVPFIYIMIIIVAVYFFVNYDILKTKNITSLLEGKGKDIAKIFFSAGFAYTIAYVLKIVIHTDRPFIALSNINSLFTETGYAFPSGHSATIAALSMSVYFKNKKLGYICMVAALLIGLARVASGVHFPVDIIGGYAIGFLVAFFVKTL
jgi:undecaprenyl-diphosphatase